ncbi:MAG: hypothetical protein HOP11_14885 [Saprospiraceae bacterium]|nr:hypothetical protein [Saprospiraceae bacterium]
MDFILELLKILGPAVVVFATVYYLLKQYFTHERFRLNSAQFQKNNEQTLPLKLQAYERLALFLERIKLSNLMLRLPKGDMNPSQWMNTLMLGVQQEYEHNLVQQVYVSDQLWNIVNLAKDEVMHSLHTIAEKYENNQTSLNDVNEVTQHSEKYVQKALEAIKQEVKLVLQ